jgi:hypothetical protein
MAILLQKFFCHIVNRLKLDTEMVTILMENALKKRNVRKRSSEDEAEEIKFSDAQNLITS